MKSKSGDLGATKRISK